jgi:GTP-dependent phosphoenolpyruvate carboxykinase
MEMLSLLIILVNLSGLYAYKMTQVQVPKFHTGIGMQAVTKAAAKSSTPSEPPTKNAKLLAWVNEIAALTKPRNIKWCDGSKKEYNACLKEQVDAGIAIPLDKTKKPGCVLFRSDPSDVARVEDRTFIASKSKDDAGPTNNWFEPSALKTTMKSLYSGCMAGRTMYVIPFSMGPIGELLNMQDLHLLLLS